MFGGLNTSGRHGRKHAKESHEAQAGFGQEACLPLKVPPWAEKSVHSEGTERQAGKMARRFCVSG